MTSKSDEALALLATRSDALAAGMSALLLSIPPIHQVKILEDVTTLVDFLTTEAPILIIVDTNLIVDGAATGLSDIRDRAPHSLRVLLTESMREYRQLQPTTQDTVIIKGTDPAELASRLEFLLQSYVGHVEN